MKITRVRVVLRGIAPVVVRVLDVPASVTLPELHELLQVALAWPPAGLLCWHEFVVGGVHYGVPDQVLGFCLPGERDERGVRLAELPERFVYRCNADLFGRDWDHDVDLLGPGGDQPGCVYGEGRCPPAGSGGESGFYPYYPWLCEALADPAHRRHAQACEWVERLSEFDQADTDAWVRRMVGQVPDSVGLVLRLAADGVKLTPGGRLPRVFVRRVHQQRPNWRYGGADNPAWREEDLSPLAALHRLLREVGLLRLRNGVLAPTRAAGDELEVVRRLRSWFVPGTFSASVATLIVAAVVTSRDGERSGELGGLVQPELERGSWVTSGGRPITGLGRHLTITTIELSSVLRGLDLVERDWSDWDVWRAGPSATCFLPHVTAMARLWFRTPRGRDGAAGLQAVVT
ncbi:MAG TPA: plasmid pRiA4b ORF-3 family protein [Pseudonocardia sp.]|uniref:plasmid pRiA4b ORF-3 family protein n=1 Tax=Pseudonocardia sp. TaxID=60912 RepID=UPI002F3FC182